MGRSLQRGRALLRLAQGVSGYGVAAELGLCVQTAYRVRQRYEAQGLAAALGEWPRSGGPRRFDGTQRAALTAPACTPPGGHSHRILHLPAAEARALAARFEVHYTPKKASWLNLVELELSAIARQCLRQRIPTQDELSAHVAACVAERNAARATVKWQFSFDKACLKLDRHYQKIRVRTYANVSHFSPSGAAYR